jgi:hypothetical protein
MSTVDRQRTEFEFVLTLTLERVNAIDTMCVVLLTDDALAIVDIRLTLTTGKARLASATKHNVVTF